jgi:hypothetical protein
MLGFTPFSTNPISDIQLPAITGTINVTDSNDTATLTGTVANPIVTGTISATDTNDTANITGAVLVPSTGTISATDGNDTANITGFVGVPTPTNLGGDDGFTKKEYKRYKALQAAKQKAEQDKLDALRKSKADRKAGIKELLDPSPKNKQKKNKVQSNQEVSEDIPSEITALDNTIANLVKQEQELLHGVMLRQELVRIQTEMAILEAKRLQELDDEEALLLLL